MKIISLEDDYHPKAGVSKIFRDYWKYPRSDLLNYVTHAHTGSDRSGSDLLLLLLRGKVRQGSELSGAAYSTRTIRLSSLQRLCLSVGTRDSAVE